MTGGTGDMFGDYANYLKTDNFMKDPQTIHNGTPAVS